MQPALVGLVLCALSPAQDLGHSQDHLEPLRWRSPESCEYHRTIEDLLAFHGEPFGLLTLPSFTPESFVWLERTVEPQTERTTGAKLSYAVTNANVHGALQGFWSDPATAPPGYAEAIEQRVREHQERVRAWSKAGGREPWPRFIAPSLLAHVRVEKTVVDFPPELAERIETLWRRMLLEARYAEHPVMGCDGVSYVVVAQGMLGETWSPAPGTKPALLVDLGESLAAFAQGPSPRGEPALDPAADARTRVGARAERYTLLRSVETRIDALERRLDGRNEPPVPGPPARDPSRDAPPFGPEQRRNEATRRNVPSR